MPPPCWPVCSVVGQNHFPIIFQSRRPLRNVGLNHFPVLSHNDYFGSHPDAMTPRDLAFFIEPFSSSENGKYRPTYRVKSRRIIIISLQNRKVKNGSKSTTEKTEGGFSGRQPWTPGVKCAALRCRHPVAAPWRICLRACFGVIAWPSAFDLWCSVC